MTGSANVDMKGPSDWNAEILTQRLSSLKSFANTGARVVLLMDGVQAQDTVTMTSAQAFLTPHTSS